MGQVVKKVDRELLDESEQFEGGEAHNADNSLTATNNLLRKKRLSRNVM